MLILDRSATLAVASLPDCIDAVEAAFTAYARGRSLGLARIHLEALGGGTFHLVAGGLADGDEGAVALKLNGRFPPAGGVGGQRVTGVVLLSDATSGAPIAILDSMVVTSLRTAAVTAVVVRALARADARSALLVGAGRQGRGQLDALIASGRVERLLVHDLVPESADRLALTARELGIDADVAADVGAAAAVSDVVVTITPAREPVLRDEDVRPGTLVVALGADGPGKQELDPRLVARSRLVVDLVDQAAESGELQHALAAGLMAREDVYAELGELLAGGKPAATAAEEVVVFDGTGTALQDIAAAQLLVAEARRRGIGLDVDLTA